MEANLVAVGEPGVKGCAFEEHRVVYEGSSWIRVLLAEDALGETGVFSSRMRREMRVNHLRARHWDDSISLILNEALPLQLTCLVQAGE